MKFDDLERKLLLFAEGDSEPEGAPEPDPEPTPEPAPEPEKAPEAEWRGLIESDEGKTFAKTSPDINHLVNRAVALQKQVSRAIVPPGKDATEDDIAAYRKRIGVPESPDKYEFSLPEGYDADDSDKAFQKGMAETFHKLNINSEQAKGLNEAYNAAVQSAVKAQQEADREFANQTEAELRKRWSGEFDKNKAFAENAAKKVFGDNFDEAKVLETKDGRFLLDHPLMLEALAAIGREMEEGGLLPKLSDEERNQAEDQLRDIRKKIAEAQSEGDNKRANRLYQEEQALIAKTMGNQPIVGSEARAA